MIAGKIWGKTEAIHQNGLFEFHRIEFNKGYKCSEHLHEFKWNGFYVESGTLLIRVWQNDYDLVDETILGPGDWTKVKPGVYHQFECIEDAIAFEVYFSEFSHNDIVRENVGFQRD
jgi:mannose-6-phosphate isomerase-like protein (cupin superfamily)